jgi:hypothetical protein
MPGLFVRRFRVFMLLLAFCLGLGVQVASSAAMAAQMQGPAQAGISSGAVCPGCDADMQHSGLAPSCTLGSCSTIPALPAQSTVFEPLPRAVFPATADAMVTGITSAPDPHPPRVSLHS